MLFDEVRPTWFTLAKRTAAMNATRVFAGATSYGPHFAISMTKRLKKSQPISLLPSRNFSIE